MVCISLVLRIYIRNMYKVYKISKFLVIKIVYKNKMEFNTRTYKKG